MGNIDDMKDAISISRGDWSLRKQNDVIVISGKTAFDKRLKKAFAELTPSPTYETGTTPVLGGLHKNRAQRRKEEKQNRRKAKTTKRGTTHV